MTTDQHAELTLKIILVGDSQVGKTSVMTRFVSNAYAAEQPTIGVGYGVKSLEIERKRVKVQIWDTVISMQAGQESFKAIAMSYFRGAHGAVLVYSIDDWRSFENLGRWVEDIRGGARQDLPVCLMGNKNDLDARRRVDGDKGARFAEGNGFCGFVETSAITGENVEEGFKCLLNRLVQDEKRRDVEGGVRLVSRVQWSEKGNHSRNCCD